MACIRLHVCCFQRYDLCVLLYFMNCFYQEYLFCFVKVCPNNKPRACFRFTLQLVPIVVFVFFLPMKI